MKFNPTRDGEPYAATARLDARTIRTLALASLGGALEYYDFIVAVFFTRILGAVFFPPQTPEWLAQIEVFSIFAAGYLIRPIGGILFAHFGDRFGRKRMFALSLFLMCVPTVVIGCLPGYATIGMAAPVLLLACRLLQGLSVGGEVPGAWIFCAEHVREERVGLACGLLLSGMCVGILLGSLSATFLGGSLTHSQLMAWGWRAPFIAGGVFGLLAVYLRRYLHETPVFEALRAKRAVAAGFPLVTVLRSHRKAIMLSMLVTWVYAGMFVLYFLYMPTYLQSHWHLDNNTVFAANSWSIFALLTGCVCAGWIADRLGDGRAFFIGSAFMLIVVVALSIALSLFSSAAMAIYIGGGFFISAITLVPCIIIRSFPPEIRFTGFSLSYNTAFALFGGTAPALVSMLVSREYIGFAPMYYMSGLALLGMLIGFSRLRVIASDSLESSALAR